MKKVSIVDVDLAKKVFRAHRTDQHRTGFVSTEALAFAIFYIYGRSSAVCSCDGIVRLGARVGKHGPRLSVPAQN